MNAQTHAATETIYHLHHTHAHTHARTHAHTHTRTHTRTHTHTTHTHTHIQDGLLSQGYSDLIMRIYNMIPKVTPEGRRLQVRGRQMMLCDSKCRTV